MNIPISITEEEFETLCFAIDRIEKYMTLFEYEDSRELSEKHLTVLRQIDLKLRGSRYEEEQTTAIIDDGKEIGLNLSRARARRLLREYKII